MTPILFKAHALKFFAIAMTLLLFGTPTQSLAAYEFVTEFGSTGTSRGQFNAPRGVTVSQLGEIIITDSGNSRVEVCDELANCSQFGNFGDLSGEFDKPRGLAVNSADRVFIADRGNDRIASCAKTGSCTDFGGSGVVVGKFESPRGIVIDSLDRIYITDTDNNRIQTCDDQGVCTAFGSLGSALGQFNSPSGIAVDAQGKLVIADRGNDRIQICTTAGSCTAFGSFGTLAGKFNSPTGVAINSGNQIIIVDRFNDRIQVCDHQGGCTAFGSFGIAPGQFDAPWGVAVDSNDRVIIVDSGNDRIQIFAEPAAQPPDAPTSVSATDAVYTDKVRVTWGNVAGEDSYQVYRCSNTNSGTCSQIATPVANTTSYDDTGANADGTVHYYRVKACSNANGCSAFSDVDGGNRQVVVPPVNIASFTATPDSIEQGQATTFSWTVTNATACTALAGTTDWRNLTPGKNGGSVDINLSTPGSYIFTLRCTDGANTVSRNASVTVTAISSLPEMNAGLNDAWYYPVTNGQGFFITVFPEIGYVSLSWFTYDTVRPDADVTANLGEPGHRWLNAVGAYSGNQAVMNISIASGGIFDTTSEITEVNDGTITLTFTDCVSGTVEYDIPSIGQTGLVPIQRVAGDNIALCEIMADQATAVQNTSSQKIDDSHILSDAPPKSTVQATPLVTMNAGLNDAWYYPVTNGQGFFITVFPEIGYVSLSWFTYDTVRPDADVTANLGEPGHRWLNAVGVYSGNQAVMDISIASGGIFDTPSDITEVNDGTITLTFTDCVSGTVEYDITSIGQTGLVPIQRVAGDNIALCEAMAQ